MVFVHPAEFLVTGPDGSIFQRTILGNVLLMSTTESDGPEDQRRVISIDFRRSSLEGRIVEQQMAR